LGRLFAAPGKPSFALRSISILTAALVNLPKEQFLKVKARRRVEADPKAVTAD
jgi:hypothetical protein